MKPLLLPLLSVVTRLGLLLAVAAWMVGHWYVVSWYVPPRFTLAVTDNGFALSNWFPVTRETPWCLVTEIEQVSPMTSVDLVRGLPDSRIRRIPGVIITSSMFGLSLDISHWLVIPTLVVINMVLVRVRRRQQSNTDEP